MRTGEGNHGCPLFNCWISLRGIPGHAGGQGYEPTNPPTPTASGSHCRNVRTLCSRPLLALKIRGVRAHCTAMTVRGEGETERERDRERKGIFDVIRRWDPTTDLMARRKLYFFPQKDRLIFTSFVFMRHLRPFKLSKCSNLLGIGWGMEKGYNVYVQYTSILLYFHPKNNRLRRPETKKYFLLRFSGGVAVRRKWMSDKHRIDIT